ncbi:RNA-processing protein, HAT helix [Corchorus olitorius]|uniref:RNA-processing protein, HAT helix n=1 Tax=Corchorus olitorius TaxID=93759 RepID=A0A1R3KLA9_9ROSI|nr:RNA-processing protein, HAT helix [Corchorus olitorius]
MVFVSTPNSKTISLSLNPKTTTLLSLQQSIQLHTQIPISHQNFLFPPNPHSLLLSSHNPDSALLSQLNITPFSTLFLHVPLRGGKQPGPGGAAPPKPRLDFLNSKPPTNYVAGLGRGATGFTTRSDIGPARAAPELPDRSSTAIGRGRGKPGEDEDEDEGDDKGYDENQKFDEFEGNDVGLFASAEYDEDDKEADAVWEAIDQRMDSRRKDRREVRLKQEIEKYRASNPKITEQIADLKRKLHTLSAQEWDSIPEIGDYSLRNKKKRFESFVPVPDTLLEKARQEKEHVTALDPKSSGTETPWTDLTAVGEGRGTVLSLKLDRLSDSVSGVTVVDPKGYLTDLKSMKITSDANISDIKKARLLMKSITQTNPKHPPGWIAAARLEEEAGKIQAARQLIQKGCVECPKNEDVWLEACRLARPDDAKAVIAKGVKSIPNSVKLWLQAASLEHDDVNKSRVLRRGLGHMQDSVRLWKALIDLTANDEDAEVLLDRAVECCPLHLEFWLALARLKEYEKAKKVLNRAREELPKEPAIWISAAKLEEANGNNAMVGKIIVRCIRALQGEGLVIDREAWMKEAEVAERAGSVVTCQVIIRNTIGSGVEDEDRKRTWVADAEECKKRGSIETSRAIYDHALTVFLTKKSIWLKAAQLEKSHGTRESLHALLSRAVTYHPQAEVLWLMKAKEKWLAGDVPAARAILQEAYAAIPNSEEIWLAAFKLEFENHEPERARMLLAKARERGGMERVWMKSAIVERELGNTEEERRLLDEGLKRFPSFFKLWLMLGQLEERLGNLEKAKEVHESALKHCASCIPLWVSLAILEEKTNGIAKARAKLTLARKKNPRQPELWLAAIHAESRHGYKKEADNLMSKALQDQECPKSGILWAAAIEMAPRPERNTKSTDALNKCDNDPHVIAAVAKLFWHDRKVDKARNWLNRAVTAGPDIGDFWALYYKFELRHGSEEKQKDVLKRCIAAEPKHGEKWQAVSKAVENSHQPTEAILKKVVVALGKEKRATEKTNIIAR